MNKLPAKKAILMSLLFVLGLLVIDQVVKICTDLYLSPVGTSYPFWPEVFHLTSVHNYGAAFSIFSNHFGFLVLVRITACIAIVVLLCKYQHRCTKSLIIAALCILAGALGNVIDQVTLGYVRDMFDFRLIHFAVFNIADIYISISAFFIAVDLIFFQGKRFFPEIIHEKQ